jgi:glutamate-1-semialdehyde 2,1-aminomutase
MFISSTYWSDTIGLRAGLTTLQEAERRGVAQQLEQFGAKLKARLNAGAQDVGLPATCRGVDVHPHLDFELADSSLIAAAKTLYIQEMAKRGCHGNTAFYLNAAQGEAELEQTVAAAREVFTIIRDGLATGTLNEIVECPPQHDAFRRLVR